MKRINPLIIIAIIAISTALFFLLKPFNKEEQREPISDMIVLYIDSKQLITKSAIENYLNEANRKFAATMAIGKLDAEEYSDHLLAIAVNLDNSGLMLSEPIYAYANAVNQDQFEGAAIIEVADVNMLDITMKLLDKIAECESVDFEFSKIGDTRYFTCQDIAGGYNKSHLALTTNNSAGAQVLHNALSRPLSDLSIFKNHDMALYVDLNKLISSYESNASKKLSELNENIAESDYDFEIELYTSHISQLENQLIQLDNIRNSLSDDAVAIASLNFDAGRIRFTTEHQGVTFPDGLLKETSNRHLTYFDKEVIAIANYCINGDLVSQILGDNISPDMGTMLGIGRNEFGIGLQIALDALSTMNGDLTIALNSIDGEVSQRYSRYNQHSYEHLDISSLNALLITDVSDRYIIDNITRIGGDFFIRNSDGALTMSLNNKLKLYLGQQDNTLYAGINEYPILSSKPATEANWYYDIEGSVGYTVVNINALLNSNYIDLAYNNWLNSLPSLDAELIRKTTTSLDYAYNRIDTEFTNEFVVVFKNKETNALKQLVDTITPYVTLHASDLF